MNVMRLLKTKISSLINAVSFIVRSRNFCAALVNAISRRSTFSKKQCGGLNWTVNSAGDQRTTRKSHLRSSPLSHLRAADQIFFLSPRELLTWVRKTTTAGLCSFIISNHCRINSKPVSLCLFVPGKEILHCPPSSRGAHFLLLDCNLSKYERGWKRDTRGCIN